MMPWLVYSQGSQILEEGEFTRAAVKTAWRRRAVDWPLSVGRVAWQL